MLFQHVPGAEVLLFHGLRTTEFPIVFLGNPYIWLLFLLFM